MTAKKSAFTTEAPEAPKKNENTHFFNIDVMIGGKSVRLGAIQLWNNKKNSQLNIQQKLADAILTDGIDPSKIQLSLNSVHANETSTTIDDLDFDLG